MKLLPIAILAAASLAACSPPRAMDYADAGATALAIANGATEANPVVGFAGDAAAPVVALVAKVAVRSIIDAADITEPERKQAHHVMDATGAFAACNNIAAATSAAPNVSIPIGILCGVIYYSYAGPQ